MGWIAGVAILVAVHIVSSSGTPLAHLGDHIDGNEPNLEDASSAALEIQAYQDMKLEQMDKVLTDILVRPWPQGSSPLLYVEDVPPEVNLNDELEENFVLPKEEEEFSNSPFKRSRYYRKYPWKRQNSRYDPENRYLCQPTKEDVFRLLVALHEARHGSRGQNVNFCNRKRPASVVFTNIRFLG